MNPNNRWIKKAQIIPWDELETEYAALFSGKNGQVAKPLRLALGALLIQIEYGYSDEETVLQIQENPYLQYFCGLPGYEDKPPFDASLMVHFRKRLTAEFIQKANESVITRTEKISPEDKDNNPKDPSQNNGTLLVDATCAPSHIKYPQYEQQKYMYQNKVRKVAERIVNLRQPYIRPIVRGKAKTPVEFGIKLDISVVNGFVRLEHQSFNAYNESEHLKQELERYRQRYGCYPERVLADKIYRNRQNLNFCKENGIRLSGAPLGRPKKIPVIDKKLQYQDSCERVEVERAFSLTKRKFGMGLIRTYLEETSKTVIALSIFALNLHKVFCALLFAFIVSWIMLPFFVREYENRAFVQ